MNLYVLLTIIWLNFELSSTKKKTPAIRGLKYTKAERLLSPVFWQWRPCFIYNNCSKPLHVHVAVHTTIRMPHRVLLNQDSNFDFKAEPFNFTECLRVIARNITISRTHDEWRFAVQGEGDVNLTNPFPFRCKWPPLAPDPGYMYIVINYVDRVVKMSFQNHPQVCNTTLHELVGEFYPEPPTERTPKPTRPPTRPIEEYYESELNADDEDYGSYDLKLR